MSLSRICVIQLSAFAVYWVSILVIFSYEKKYGANNIKWTCFSFISLYLIIYFLIALLHHKFMKDERNIEHYYHASREIGANYSHHVIEPFSRNFKLKNSNHSTAVALNEIPGDGVQNSKTNKGDEQHHKLHKTTECELYFDGKHFYNRNVGQEAEPCP